MELTSSSRTDRGVHAEGQTVNFILKKPIPLDKLQYILNAILPKDIRIRDIFHVESSFHSSLSALKKEYRYLIQTNEIQSPFDRFTSWHHPKRLDINKMSIAKELLIGKRDFIAFQNCSKPAATTIREIEEISIKSGDLVDFTLIGNSFLYKMVRNIVGTLVYIGEGKLTLSDLERALITGDRKKLGICAPAHGLTLKRVVYDFTK